VTPDEPRRRVGALIGRVLLVALLLSVGGGTIWVLNFVTTPRQFSGPAIPLTPEFQIDRTYVEPGTATPGSADENPATAPLDASGAVVQGGPSPLERWAQHLSSNTDIPARALLAYANADITVRTMAPKCHIAWATLAGIGRVESKHGRFGGTQLGPDGRPEKPIIGPPLDGSPGVITMPATDGGALTGDPVWAHAVGPMQFLPSTWATWGTRASNDGKKPDPQSIDDAALSAARYLCAGGRDMATPAGWWAGLRTYNDSVDYGQQVFSAADAYGKASLAR
jgi:hypothetical protein